MEPPHELQRTKRAKRKFVLHNNIPNKKIQEEGLQRTTKRMKEASKESHIQMKASFAKHTRHTVVSTTRVLLCCVHLVHDFLCGVNATLVWCLRFSGLPSFWEKVQLKVKAWQHRTRARCFVSFRAVNSLFCWAVNKKKIKKLRRWHENVFVFTEFCNQQQRKTEKKRFYSFFLPDNE